MVPIAGGALAAAGVLWLGRRRVRPLVPAALAALAASALATGLGWADWIAEPPGVGATVLVAAVPASAAAAALIAIALRGRREDVAAVLVLASAATTAGWVLLHLPALWHAVVPSALPSAVVRAGLGLTAGLAVAAAVLGLRAAGGAMADRRRTSAPSAAA